MERWRILGGGRYGEEEDMKRWRGGGYWEVEDMGDQRHWENADKER